MFDAPSVDRLKFGSVRRSLVDNVSLHNHYMALKVSVMLCTFPYYYRRKLLGELVLMGMPALPSNLRGPGECVWGLDVPRPARGEGELRGDLRRGSLMSASLKQLSDPSSEECSSALLPADFLTLPASEDLEPVLCSAASALLMLSCFFHFVRLFWNQIFTCNRRRRDCLSVMLSVIVSSYEVGIVGMNLDVHNNIVHIIIYEVM